MSVLTILAATAILECALATLGRFRSALSRPSRRHMTGLLA